jgi:HD-GYP domain-containing protein (c-di-GMP phosphodiesterase class II)
MRLSYAESENAVVAAQLHDIGKIGVSDAMLIKNFTEFSAEEKEEYMKHPVIGQAVIDSVEGLRDAGMLIRHHHEWYNGDGFPDRLRYEKIPLGSRVIAMADKFDRLTNIGRDSLNMESALQKIKTLLGTQLDPDLYQFLSEVVHEKITTAIPETEDVEVELKPNDLVPGLVLSRDVRSGTGLLLLRKGTTLHEKNIDTLRRGYHLDPSKSGIFVRGKRK